MVWSKNALVSVAVIIAHIRWFDAQVEEKTYKVISSHDKKVLRWAKSSQPANFFSLSPEVIINDMIWWSRSDMRCFLAVVWSDACHVVDWLSDCQPERVSSGANCRLAWHQSATQKSQFFLSLFSRHQIKPFCSVRDEIEFFPFSLVLRWWWWELLLLLSPGRLKRLSADCLKYRVAR